MFRKIWGSGHMFKYFEPKMSHVPHESEMALTILSTALKKPNPPQKKSHNLVQLLLHKCKKKSLLICFNFFFQNTFRFCIRHGWLDEMMQTKSKLEFICGDDFKEFTAGADAKSSFSSMVIHYNSAFVPIQFGL